MKLSLVFSFIVMLIVVACSSKESPTAYSNSFTVDVVPETANEIASAEVGEIKTSCPRDMVLVEGMYCPKVSEICKYYVDIHGNKIPPGSMPAQTGRCGEFEYPTKCLSEHRVYKKFCIDKFEIPNIEGQIPTSWLNYTDAENFCKSKDKRLCSSSEWEFSCEGNADDPHPYPYGSGYIRDTTACNFDNAVPKGLDVFKATSHNTDAAKRLDAMLVPSGSMKRCISPFNVSDQIGNLDEYVVNETGKGFISGLKGGHIFGVRAACRPMTTAHSGLSVEKGGAGFAWYESSSRCCEDSK